MHSTSAIEEVRSREALGDDPLIGRDMLCFSHDWSGDPLSKTHLMRLLSKNNRILWVNSIGYRTPTASKADLARAWRKLKAATMPLTQVEPNLFVLSPLAIPAYKSTWLQKLNRWLLKWQVRRAIKKLKFTRAINWVFNPAAAIVAGDLQEELIVYYCVDEYSAFSGVARTAIVELERKLLRRADLVLVSAEALYRAKSAVHPRTRLVRHGVQFEHFRQALLAKTRVPSQIADLSGPVIGYFGLMSPDWIDLELLVAIARHFSDGTLVLVGKVAMDLSPLEAMPNVRILGRQPFESLPAFCKGFDVGIVPFPLSEVTENSNPLKAREYLAAGLPVVSTDIPEVRVLANCRVASDQASFIRQLHAALRDPGPSAERSAAMRTHSWDARLEEIREHLSDLAKGV